MHYLLWQLFEVYNRINLFFDFYYYTRLGGVTVRLSGGADFADQLTGNGKIAAVEGYAVGDVICTVIRKILHEYAADLVK